jgi:hypothetical protein
VEEDRPAEVVPLVVAPAVWAAEAARPVVAPVEVAHPAAEEALVEEAVPLGVAAVWAAEAAHPAAALVEVAHLVAPAETKEEEVAPVAEVALPADHPAVAWEAVAAPAVAVGHRVAAAPVVEAVLATASLSPLWRFNPIAISNLQQFRLKMLTA